MNLVDKKEELWNRNLIAVFIGNFLLFFSFYLLLPVLPIYLDQEFHANKQLIGLILAGYTVTTLCIRPFGGYFVDAFPRKKVLLICYFFFFVIFAGYLLASTILAFALIRAAHGFAFGSTTVSNSTVAIDVMPASRRAEGIGFYGISNNLAMVIGPSISLSIYSHTAHFTAIFWLALITSGIGFFCVSRVKPRPRELRLETRKPSTDRFFLIKGWPEGATLIFFSFAYGILSTYIAIYGLEEIGPECNSGYFFLFMGAGLILSRFATGKSLNKGRITKIIKLGMATAIMGFALFILVKIPIVYYFSALIIGMGFGAICPSYQTMFINLADHAHRGTANSTYLTSWDLGLGLGVWIGGYIAEATNYFTSFCIAFISGFAGVIIFFIFTAPHFNKTKIR